MTTMAAHPGQLPAPLLRIGATRRAATGSRTYTSISPVSEQPVAEIAAADASDVDDAVSVARERFTAGEWASMSGASRGEILFRAADLILADAENLAALEAMEMGKLFHDSVIGDIPAAAAAFRYYAGWADKITGQTAQLPDFGPQPRFGFTIRQPVGVVGAITPWNNPAMIAAWKLAPALAAGCTVVLKPAEDAALSSLRLVELLAEAGLPDGVVNVVTGLGHEAGAALAAHPGIDKLTFTGSLEVGRTLGMVAGDTFRKVTLELGGKAPQLVLPDADLDQAMQWISMGNFYHQGQVCAAGTRVIVHESLLDDVVSGLVEAAKNSRIGDPFDGANTMGSIVNEKQLNRILGYVESGRSEGASLVTGGSRVDREGYFMEPTVFVGDNDLTIAREEIFGPVATVIGYRDLEDGVRMANETKYGLSAMIYTRDLSAAHSLIPRLRVGTVWVNGWGVPDAGLPWGGRGASGIGRELGKAGVDAHTEEKTVHLGL